MRHVILTFAVIAAAMASSGCSGSSGGDNGGGGNGGTGANRGSGGGGGGGPSGPASFTGDNAVLATAGTAAAMQAAMMFGNSIASILATVPPPEAAAQSIGPKGNFDDFCPGGGSADVQIPPGFPSLWPTPSTVSLTLTDCEGSVISSAAVNGSLELAVTGVDPNNGASIDGIAHIDLDIADGTEIDGDFEANVQISFTFLQTGTVWLRLGKQDDDDLLTVARGGETLRLGCFDVDAVVSRVLPQTVSPLGVADFSGQVYTVNDYTQLPPSIEIGPDGTPVNGEATLYSGDRSDASPDRTGKCFPMVADGDTSEVTATFFANGCIQLDGIDANMEAFAKSTSWQKLLDLDFVGSDETCQADAMAPAVSCPETDDRVAMADAYVRGASHADTPFGTAPNLLLKGDPDGEYARKTYMVFDVNDVPIFSKASLVVSLQRHVSDPQPTDVSGIIDNGDWDLNERAENELTWNNAPRNDTSSGVAFLDQGNGADSGVRRLVRGYTFDRQDIPGLKDPPNTQYAFDVTDFVKWAVGQKAEFSDAANQDNDGYITLLMALSREGKPDGSALLSKEAPNPEGWQHECSPAPFLHFELTPDPME